MICEEVFQVCFVMTWQGNVQDCFVMTWCHTQHVVLVQMIIPLCVREICDVKHLHVIVVDTTRPHGRMYFGQTTEGLL